MRKCHLRIYFLFCFLYLTQDLCSQVISQRDSLRSKFASDSAHIYRLKQIRPFLSLDNRNSFIRSAPVNVQGFQAGVILKEKHTIGFGLYSIKNESKAPVKVHEQNQNANQYLNLGYLTLFYQYVILDTRFFELDLPLEIGTGRYSIKVADSLNNTVLFQDQGGLLLTGGGAAVVLKPLKWIGISGTAGYRAALDKNPRLNFNGFYYSYGVWIDLRQIYRDVRFYGFTRRKYRKELAKLNSSEI